MASNSVAVVMARRAEGRHASHKTPAIPFETASLDTSGQPRRKLAAGPSEQTDAKVARRATRGLAE